MKIFLISVSFFYFLFLSFSKYPTEIYDCSSSKFDEFPIEVKQECVRMWREEMYEIMKQLLEIELSRSYKVT